VAGAAPDRRRRPGEQANVTREQIFDAAEAFVREHGFEQLSVRQLSARLEVTPAALYWHIDGKQQLLGGVLDRAFSQVERPDPSTGNWLERLLAFSASNRDVLLRYAGVSAVMMTVPPSEITLAYSYFMYELLVEGGFTEDDAVSLFIALSTFSIGHLMMVDTAHLTRGRGGSTFTPNASQLRPFLADRPEFAPFLRRMVDFDDAKSRAQYLAGVELLIRGAATSSGVRLPL